MPLVYKSPGIPNFVLRKPPSHFVFDTEKDLIASNSIAVYRAWKADFEPDMKAGRINVEQLLQFGERLDRMTLWETRDGGADYMIRFHGAEIGRIFGEGMGGLLSLTPKPHFDALMEILDLLQSSRSVVVNGPALNALPGREFLVSQSLFMPVFADDDAVQQVLVYSDYFIDGSIEKT